MGLDDVACFAYLPLRHVLSTRLKPQLSKITDPLSGAGSVDAHMVLPFVGRNYGCYISVFPHDNASSCNSTMYITLGRSVAVADSNGSLGEYVTTDARNMAAFTTLEPLTCTDTATASAIATRAMHCLMTTKADVSEEIYVLWMKRSVS